MPPFFASKQCLDRHDLKKHPPTITFEETHYKEMKNRDIFTNDSDNESENSEDRSEHSSESDNESENSEKSEENDGDDEDSGNSKEDDQSENESGEEEDEESEKNESDEDEESIWDKISNMAHDSLADLPLESCYFPAFSLYCGHDVS